ncbi:MAG: MFS transporter [Chloroflexi bacterium]|nr:MAG: MFS transporter [Chloroflexota bacterium]
MNATIAAFDAAGRQSLFPTLVPRGQLQNAITLNSMLFRSSNLVGPAVAGLLIAHVGVASPFFVNAVSYFAIIVALLAMRIPAVSTRSRGSIRQELVGGLRYVRASAILPLILAIEASLSVFGHNQALITIFARDVLGTDAEGLGLLLSSIGAGAIAGMVLLVIVGDVRRKGAFMLGAAFSMRGCCWCSPGRGRSRYRSPPWPCWASRTRPGERCATPSRSLPQKTPTAAALCRSS